MTQATRMMRYGGFVVIVAAACLLGACASNGPVTPGSVRSNPSPELEGMARTHEQRKNDTAKTFHVNGRQIWDDIDMIMLWDRPSRLTRYPVP